MRKILLAIAMMLVLALNVFAAIPTLGDTYMGEANAPVKVIQFVDFSSSSDRSFLYDVLIPLWSDYIDTGKVQLIIKDFPGTRGWDAANAAECADDFGKYKPIYTALFNRYYDWVNLGSTEQKQYFKDIANYHGITQNSFTVCLENNVHYNEIAEDKQHGQQNNVYDTPTVFVDGKKLYNPNYNTLRGEIETALNDSGGEYPPISRANIQITPSGRTISMEKYDSESVSYTLQNTGGKTADITLSTTDNSNDISTEPSVYALSLGPGSTRNITFTITTTNATNGTYGVNLHADYDGKRKTAVTTVNVNTYVPPVQYANIEFSPSGRTVTMDRYDSDSVSYDVRNTGNKGTYVDLSVSDNSGYINSSVSTTRFWLGADSSRSVTVYIETDNASNGNYNVALRAEYDGKTRTANTNVYVNYDDYEPPQTGSITLDAVYKTVCRGEYHDVTVRVKNNASYGRNIELWAESEMFLPYFTDEDIYLSGYASKNVTLRFYVPAGTSTGTKYINIYAKSGSRTYSDTARISVSDCDNDDDNNNNQDFRLTLQSSCKRIEKGEKTTYNFTLRNITNDDIRVDLQVVSDLPTEFKDHVPVYLDSYESVNLEFEVKSRKTDDTGRHEIIVHAWDDDYNTKESTCVYLEGTNEIDVDLVNNDLKIERGSFEVFTLLVENRGDFEENVDIEVNNYFEGIEVTISDRHFDLDDGESQEVYISVTATDDAELGSYELSTLVTNGETLRETLRFEVTGYDADYNPYPDVDEPVYEDFEIVSYPGDVSVTMSGDNKVEFTIGNTGQYPIYGMRVSLENFPRGIYIDVPDFDIMPGETKTIEGQITVSDEVEEGTYEGKIRFASEGFVDKKNVKVTVEPDDLGELASGLFAMGTNVLLGIVVLLVVIGAILLISKLVQGGTPRREKREAWEED